MISSVTPHSEVQEDSVELRLSGLEADSVEVSADVETNTFSKLLTVTSWSEGHRETGCSAASKDCTIKYGIGLGCPLELLLVLLLDCLDLSMEIILWEISS